ncbi:MAG: transcriptional repressor [Muribaculaceae bacterium]
MIEDKSKIAAKTKFTLYLEGKKLRKTPERFAILDKIFSINDHFDVESLYSFLEGDFYHVSRATVYNTIDLLCDCGLVRKHQFGNQQAQYEKVGGAVNHHHLICTECGKIKEVKDSEILGYMNSQKYPAFTTSYFSLYVYGLCNNCLRKMKRKNKVK